MKKMVDRDLEKEFKDVIIILLDLVIVCAMWITGFECSQVSLPVYLDKTISKVILL